MDSRHDPGALRAAYSAFLRPHEPARILLTGHSHQAWPDVAREAQARYFDDSARWVDQKWGRAVFPCLDRVRRGVLTRMGFAAEDALTFGRSTHELVFRLLTCLRWSDRPRIVTTGGEFHSLYRQLRRLEEEGVEVVWVDGAPRATLAERLRAAIDERTALVAVSAVFFEDAYVLREVSEVMAYAVERGALPLVDAYHAFHAVPLDWGPAREHLFVTAGGYKYAQFGEGVCWLRIPSDCTLRPVYTGWFADFASLEDPRSDAPVTYGPGGDRFAGATFDASALYRADAVLGHFEQFGLDPAALRALSQRQTARLIARLDRAGVLDERVTLASPRDPERRAGFVSVRIPGAHDVVHALAERGVSTDARGDLLRLGPAPYTLDQEIDDGVDALAEVLRARR